MSLMEFFIVMMLGVGFIVTGGVVIARITYGLGRPVFRQCACDVQAFMSGRQRQPELQRKTHMTERLQALSAANQECVALEEKSWFSHEKPAFFRRGLQVRENDPEPVECESGHLALFDNEVPAPVLEVIPVECYETDILEQSEPIVAETMLGSYASAEPIKRDRAEVLTDFRRRFRAA